jgi:pantoate--beta-alanine ligase
MAGIVGDAGLARLDYAEVVDAHTLEPVADASGEVRLLVAARFGSTRLLDNLGVVGV